MSKPFGQFTASTVSARNGDGVEAYPSTLPPIQLPVYENGGFSQRVGVYITTGTGCE